MKKKFGTCLSLLMIACAVTPSCIISSCRANDDSVYIKPRSVNNAEFNSETNTLKITNDYYNPLATEKDYLTWLALNAVLKSDEHAGYSIEECTLDWSNVPDDLKNKIFVTLENGSCFIYFEQSANILEWDEFTITVNYDCGISKGSYTFNVAAQRQGRVYAGTLGVFTGGGNKDGSMYALTGLYDVAFNCKSQMLGNFQKLEILSDPRVRYLYDNFMNLLEDKQPYAPGLSGGVFGPIYSSHTDPSKDYEIKTEDDQKLWDWNFGTADSHTSGRWNNLIIDDYENNPNWKQDGYKTLQIGNPYTWRSWNKMFYKCYSLLPSLHHYFDGFTNEVPIVKDGSSTGEPGTPTETYQFTPEDVDAMVYGY